MATLVTDEDPGSGQRPPGGTRRASRWVLAHRWLLGTVVLLLLIYTLAGFLLLPWVARKEIRSYVQHDLGREISIASIRFNPFTFTAEVRGLTLSEANGSPIVEFGRLLVNAELSSVLHFAWTFKEIRLEQPDIHVVVGPDGSVNLARLKPAAPAAPSTPSTGLPRLRIGLLAVVDGTIHYEDDSRGRAFTTALRPIQFTLSDFRTAPDHDNRYAFNARTQADETLSWAGEFRVGPLGSNGEFQVQGLLASTITSYLKDALPLRVPTGKLDLQGTYSLATQPKLNLAVTLAAVKLRDITLAPKQASVAAPWITLPTLDVTDTVLSLAERRIAIGTIEARDASIKLWREPSGQINLSQLMATPVSDGTAAAGPVTAARGAVAVAAPEGSTPTPKPAVPTWHFSLGTLDVRNAQVQAEDRAVKPAARVQLAPINISLKHYSSDPGSQFDLDATVGIDKGRIAASGRVGLAPFDAALKLTLKDLDLPLAQPYIQPALKLTRGRLSANLKLALASMPARDQPTVHLTGDAEVADLVTRDDAENQNLVTWKSVRVAGLDYQQMPDRLRIQRVVATQPYGRVIISADSKLNITQVLQGTGQGTAKVTSSAKASARSSASAPAAARAASAAGASMPISIGTIQIKDGAADFTDLSVQPDFSTGMVGLHGSVTGISSNPASRAKVQLDGEVDRYAPVSISGEFNLLSAVTYTDIRMKFSNMELTTFNPYSGKFAGYSIKQGKLSTELHYKIDNRKLDAQHHIVIDQLEFGAATGSKQAVPLPVRLAAALLKDRNGVITLDLPVSGSIDDPKFRVGPLIWKVFVGLIRKIVTAPFAALGALFGHGADLSYVDFPAGSAVLPQPALDKLTTLAKALADRPVLKLSIPLHASSPADTNALTHAAFESALGGPATLASLEALYRKTLGAAPVYPDKDPAGHVAWLSQALLPRFEPTPEQLLALGRARAEAVRAAVLMNTAVMPERVFLTDTGSGTVTANAAVTASGAGAGTAAVPTTPGTTAGGPAAPAPSARMQLKLE